MARRIMARRRTLVSRNAATPTYTGPGPEDLLENKLEQLNSLLWFCHGGIGGVKMRSQRRSISTI